MLTKQTVTKDNALFETCLMAVWEWAQRIHSYQVSASQTMLRPEKRETYAKRAEDLTNEMRLCMEQLVGKDTHTYNLLLEHFDHALTHCKVEVK